MKGLAIKIDTSVGLPSGADSQSKSSKFGTTAIVLLGISKILVCHGFIWNLGLTIGAVPFLINTILWASGSVFLGLCMAEMASALPFTGGIYGFVRGIIGPYLGFFVGVFELCTGLLLIGVYIVVFSYCLNLALGFPDSYQVLFYPLPYIICSILLCCRRKYLAHTIITLTIIGLIFFAIYVIGGFTQMNQNRYGNHPDARPVSVDHQIHQLFRNSSYALFFFWGLESIPVISSEADKPNKSIPISVLVSTGFSIFAAILVILIASWQYPGPKVLSHDILALSQGYANIFHIARSTANIFTVPATLAAIITGIYFLCNIVRSMAQSGLLPSYFQRTTQGEQQIPYTALVAVILGSILCTMCQVISIVVYPRAAAVLVIMVQYCIYFNFFCIYGSYLIFRKQYAGREYGFRSPLGDYGAYAGIFMTCGMVLCNLFPFYGYMGYSLGGFLVLFAIATVSYIFYAAGNQRFSPEEEKVFFVAYIIRANRRQREALKRGSRSPSHRVKECDSVVVNNNNSTHLLRNHSSRDKSNDTAEVATTTTTTTTTTCSMALPAAVAQQPSTGLLSTTVASDSDGNGTPISSSSFRNALRFQHTNNNSHSHNNNNNNNNNNNSSSMGGDGNTSPPSVTAAGSLIMSLFSAGGSSKGSSKGSRKGSSARIAPVVVLNSSSMTPNHTNSSSSSSSSGNNASTSQQYIAVSSPPHSTRMKQQNNNSRNDDMEMGGIDKRRVYASDLVESFPVTSHLTTTQTNTTNTATTATTATTAVVNDDDEIVHIAERDGTVLVLMEAETEQEHHNHHHHHDDVPGDFTQQGPFSV